MNPEERERWAPKFEYKVGELDTDSIKAEMEAQDFRWDYVEAAVDYLSKPDEIAKNMGNFIDLDPNEEERLMSAIHQKIEWHTKNYVAGNNQEAIGVYSSPSWEVTQFVGDKIREKLTFTNL